MQDKATLKAEFKSELVLFTMFKWYIIYSKQVCHFQNKSLTAIKSRKKTAYNLQLSVFIIKIIHNICTNNCIMT
jgi:hypothetical protein